MTFTALCHTSWRSGAVCFSRGHTLGRKSQVWKIKTSRTMETGLWVLKLGHTPGPCLQQHHVGTGSLPPQPPAVGSRGSFLSRRHLGGLAMLTPPRLGLLGVKSVRCKLEG